MVGAAFLQLNKVRDACADFLVSRFHAHNVLGIRQFADNLGCNQLVAEAEKFIHKNFTNVSQSEEFLGLGVFKRQNHILSLEVFQVLHWKFLFFQISTH